MEIKETDPIPLFPEGGGYYTESAVRSGIVTICLNSWFDFCCYAKIEMLNHFGYIWRGQKDDLPLLPKFWRKSNNLNIAAHHAGFKRALRGLRAPGLELENNNEIWALGQHHGLATPLLDWARSPFVAAFFAAVDAYHAFDEKREKIYLYALSEEEVRIKYDESHDDKNLRIFTPAASDNFRLIGQDALFTFLSEKKSVEEWVKSNFQGNKKSYVLIKFEISLQEKNSDNETRESEEYESRMKDLKDFLRFLNRMNINHRTLFPDIEGAARYSNLQNEIEFY